MMESAKTSEKSNYKSVKRFLQTAVVVDDRPYMESEQKYGPKEEVTVPDQNTSIPPSQPDSNRGSRKSENDLDAKALMDSFAKLGVICGIVDPSQSQSEMEVMRKADIVILDWQLKEDDGEYALKLLGNLLTEKQDRNSLRLIAIYTGEERLYEKIYNPVLAKLKEVKLYPEGDKNNMVLSYQHGCMVLYAKPNVDIPKHLNERIVSEQNLPKRLIEDFSEMTEGLLPRIALTSLTAVREGEHKILDQFSSDLDPAFLTHRVCLSDPDDAGRHIVNHFAEELRGLMDNHVAEESPVNIEVVEEWLKQKSIENGGFKFGKKELLLEDAITLTKEGLEKATKLIENLSKNSFKNLTSCFAGHEKVDDKLDLRLAWMMSFRTVYNEPPPTLWLGSVVTENGNDGEDKHLICMTPRCDCVRLNGETTFFFLPLVEPKKKESQLVLKINDKFKRMSIGLDVASWIFRNFKPLESKQTIIAEKKESEGLGDQFFFDDTKGVRYIWRGELKFEHAQRIAQNFATKLSRVALDESEWLRRIARQ